MEGVGKVMKEHPSTFWCLSPTVLASLPCALTSTVAEGGMISDSRAADFLFSCDASHPDTLRYPKATWQCLSVHDEPGVGDGSCSPLIYRDDRKRLEMSNFLDVGVKIVILLLSFLPRWHAWSSSFFPISSRVFPAVSQLSEAP